MTARQFKRARQMLTRPRRLLVLASAVVIAVVVSTSITQAAWIDNEWAHGGVGASSPGDCASNTMFTNQASGRQLTGTVAGTDLETLVGVRGVRAVNDGTATMPIPNDLSVSKVDANTYVAKLPVGILNSTILAPALGLGLPVGALGTYTQWSQAEPNGKAHGAAGLVSDQTGAVDVTGTAQGAGTGPTAAKVNLENLVPAALAGLSLDVGAVASSSQVDGCEMASGWPRPAAGPKVARDYGIAGIDLNAKVPAVGALSQVYTGLPESLEALGAESGVVSTGISSGLFTLLNPVVKSLSTLLAPLSLGNFTTKVTLEKLDLTEVEKLLTAPLADSKGVLSVDLSMGTVRINIASLVGGEHGLNNLNANHEVVLDDAILNRIATELTSLLDVWKGKVLDAVLLAVRSVKFHFTSTSNVRLLLPIASVEVDAGPATLGQFLDGTAPVPIVSVKLLGKLEAPLVDGLTSALLGGTLGVVTNVLSATVFGANALVPKLGASLAGLLKPAVTAVGKILKPFSSLVSIRVNVQPDHPWAGDKPLDVSAQEGEYKVSAIRVGLVNSASLLSLSLANSSSGPAKLRP